MQGHGSSRALRRGAGVTSALGLVLVVLLALAPAGASARLAGAGVTPFATTPPKVTKQPVSVTVEEGQPATFESTASGSPTPSIGWELSTNGGATWTVIEGATSSVFTIPSTTVAESGHEFRVTFRSTSGQATSRVVTLTVQNPPTVTLQPASKLTEEGHAVSFESTAAGSPAPTIQWQSQAPGATTWKNVAGASSTVLTVANPKTSESQTKFRAVFTNAAGEAISEAATMTVANAPKITKNPANTTTRSEASAVFNAAASGSPQPSVIWEVSTDHGATWTVIPGSTSTLLTVKNVQPSDSGNQYRARFTNVAGTVASAAGILTVQSKPFITSQPHNVIALVGSGASFEATAEGVPDPAVQWEVSIDHGTSWNAIEGATSTTFSIAEAQLAQNGNLYRAVFSNVAGTTASAAARLVVSASDYAAFGWGMNNHGEVGSGSLEAAISSPVPVKGIEFVTAVSAGMRHSLALLADGTVDSWGFNSRGQLGQAGASASRVPIAVEHIETATAVAAGASHSLALLAGGTVMAWGDDESGQLGNGNHTDSEIPIPVSGLSGVTAIAAGGEHSLALLADGTVVAWGNNQRGQLGNGNTTSSDTPVAVKGLSNVAAIAAGGEYSLALRKDGTVMAWGDDESGQLGNNQLRVEEEAEETPEREEEGLYSKQPVEVEALSGITQIAAGRTHALALLADATVKSWGQNSEGELGDGTVSARVDTPVAVSALSGVTALAAGDQESAALLAGGTVDAWGNNASGQLGQGTTGADSSTPVTVGSLGGAVGIAAGGSHMLAFGAALPAVNSISPKSGSTAGGTTVTITGVDLGGASAVKFGTAAASSLTVNSSTSITATAPAGTGTVHVTVVTPAGTSPAVAADRYTYRLAPTVTKLSAKGGPATGGTSVTITGTELSGATEVDFGGVAASGLTIASDESITVTAPANVSGTVDVRVLAAYGESAVTKKDQFKYAPVIQSFAPPSAPHAGGVTVEVSGAGFALGSATKFKFGRATAKSVSCTSTTSCTLVVPAQAAAGTVDVLATANKAKSAIGPSDTFTYE